ncbi:putative mannitol dehydrogenase [Senna tora]|uniref:Putative mannitol dehydrogenase n=1 Tax=Senna tora TaxID=362788 RepID=A0A834TWE8_9FABA|nr:putative mannitol dehydrogenase [Senna tora]
MAELEHPRKAFGWAARDPSDVLSPFNFSRRETGHKDVSLKVLYCGICHSDLHMIKNQLGISNYPRDCCDNLENYCPKLILTYAVKNVDGTINYGGYSDFIVVDEHFVVRIPHALPLDAAAPLLCAGITVYSPLRYFGLHNPGLHVGVVGLGGLGHMAVKFAKAFGAKVTVISTCPNKKKEAIQHLGADSFVISHEADQMQGVMGSLDGIIDTVFAVEVSWQTCNAFCTGEACGAATLPFAFGKLICGSGIGGMKETQEMLDFAAQHNIKADIELIPMDYVNTAMERLQKADVKFRFVIDIGNTLNPTS